MRSAVGRLGRNLVAAVLGAAVMVATTTAASSAGKPSVAVLRIQARQRAPQWWQHGGAEAAQDVFVTELRSHPKLGTILSPRDASSGLPTGRRRRTAKLGNFEIQLLMGANPRPEAVRVGKQLGVEYVLASEISRNDGERQGLAKIHSRLIDTRTGKIEWQDQARSGLTQADVMTAIRKLAEKLGGHVRTQM